MLFLIGVLVLYVATGGVEAESNSAILDRLNNLENKVSAQDSEIVDLRNMVASQQKEIKELRESHCNAKPNDVVQMLQDTRGKDLKRRFVLDTLETIAFEATISAPKQVQHNNIHQRVLFDDYSMNVGNGYHPGNGTFIAPVAGIYIFSTSVMMNGANLNDRNMQVAIEKNGLEIAGAFAYNMGQSEHSSVSAAMQLQKGDSVYVSVERHNDISFYGDRLTNFMGFLLYPF